jgi:F-type H+-transporting ATPase subunit b
MVEINIALLIAQLGTFLVAVAFLWKIAWKPIVNVIEARQEKLKNDLELIERSKQAAAQMEKECAARLAQIEAQAKAIISAAHAQGQAQREELLAHAQEEMKQLREKTKIQMYSEETRILQDMIDDTLALSLELTEKLLHKSVDRQSHDQLFQEAIRSMELSFSKV